MYNRQLDTFIRVADTGSFGKAAESLFISVPAVMQQINLLEQHCGFALFIRSNRGMKLTPAGQCFYDGARKLIALSDETLAQARRIANEADAVLRIGTSTLFKCRVLPELLPAFSRAHPHVKIEMIRIPNSPHSPATAVGDAYDLKEGTVSARLGGRFLPFGSTPICCAVNPRHPLAARARIAPEDLRGETLIMPDVGVSDEMDRFRALMLGLYPDIKILASSYYGEDTFMQCEVSSDVLITHAAYADIHPNLTTLPLDVDIAFPYGIMYALKPSPTVSLLIDVIEKELPNLAPKKWLRTRAF